MVHTARHDVRVGAFLTPSAGDRDGLLDVVAHAETVGIDLVSFQDHPYQPSFFDTWTLLSYVAARTSTIRLAPNVLNMGLRPPAVVARSAAALDRLTDGRVDLGLGSGYFTDAMESLGAPPRSPGELVDALAEAIGVVRALWQPGPPVHVEGAHHRLVGAQPGPPPAHPIEIWVGAYKRRMLELTAHLADGWVPTLAYAGPDELVGLTTTLDAAMADAGRDPASLRRLYNVSGTFGPRGTGYLHGPPELWVEQLGELAVELGFTTFVLAPGDDPHRDLEILATEVKPGLVELVDAARRQPLPAAAPPVEVHAGDASAAVGTAVDPADDRVEPDAGEVTPQGAASQRLLLDIHGHLREELARLRDTVAQVEAGEATPQHALDHLAAMTLRQNRWTMGAFCAAYCRVVATHHAIEDARMFPDLRAADEGLGPILDRLGTEHQTIASLLDAVEAALVAAIADPTAVPGVRAAVDALAEALLVHLDDEEGALLEPIGRLGLVI